MNNLKKLRIGILGVGEVGSSLAKIITPKHHLFLKDIKKDTIGKRKLDVLHICLPFNQKFASLVLNQVKLNQPRLVIIDSTVPLNTVEKIHQKIKSVLLVHSPIRGTHPNLSSDIKKFTKFIGPTSVSAGEKAQQYYQTLGITTRVLNSSRETEMGKLLDTTYYALCIAWHQEMNRFCQKFNINFDHPIIRFIYYSDFIFL